MSDDDDGNTSTQCGTTSDDNATDVEPKVDDEYRWAPPVYGIRALGVGLRPSRGHSTHSRHCFLEHNTINQSDAAAKQIVSSLYADVESTLFCFEFMNHSTAAYVACDTFVTRRVASSTHDSTAIAHTAHS